MTKLEFNKLKNEILDNVLWKDSTKNGSFFISMIGKQTMSLEIQKTDMIITNENKKFVTREKSNIVAEYEQREMNFNRKVWVRV